MTIAYFNVLKFLYYAFNPLLYEAHKDSFVASFDSTIYLNAPLFMIFVFFELNVIAMQSPIDK